MTTRKRFTDALDASDSSGDDTEEETLTEKKKQKRTFTLEELEQCGYRDRPSILFVPEPKQAESTTITTETWSSAVEERNEEDQDERDAKESEEIVEAVTTEVEAVAEFAMKRMEFAEQQRLLKRKEQKKLAKQRKLTFNQKEKAKRKAGQASGGGKNFIQEEKRIGRNFGLYSGFDT